MDWFTRLLVLIKNTYIHMYSLCVRKGPFTALQTSVQYYNIFCNGIQLLASI